MILLNSMMTQRNIVFRSKYWDNDNSIKWHLYDIWLNSSQEISPLIKFVQGKIALGLPPSFPEKHYQFSIRDFYTWLSEPISIFRFEASVLLQYHIIGKKHERKRFSIIQSQGWPLSKLLFLQLTLLTWLFRRKRKMQIYSGSFEPG